MNEISGEKNFALHKTEAQKKKQKGREGLKPKTDRGKVGDSNEETSRERGGKRGAICIRRMGDTEDKRSSWEGVCGKNNGHTSA